MTKGQTDLKLLPTAPATLGVDDPGVLELFGASPILRSFFCYQVQAMLGQHVLNIEFPQQVS